MTPEDEARFIKLERLVDELRTENAMWRARGLDELRFKSLGDLYAPKAHTH